jgi:hypothetical protein
LGFDAPHDGTDLRSNIEEIKAQAARHLAAGAALRDEIKKRAARLAVESLEMGVIVRDVLAGAARRPEHHSVVPTASSLA